MTIIDPSTNIGKLRLRVADYGDLPYLPDSVYTQTLSDNDNNLVRSSKVIAMYILGMLAFKTHRRMSVQLEVWGAEAFKNYKEFLLLTVSNPAFMQLSPVPYSAASSGVNPLVQFQGDWNKNYYSGTQSQQLAFDALNSPNDGSLYGPVGGSSEGWQLT